MTVSNFFVKRIGEVSKAYQNKAFLFGDKRTGGQRNEIAERCEAEEKNIPPELQLRGMIFYDDQTQEVYEASDLLTNPETDNKQDDEQNDADSNPPFTNELPKHLVASDKQGGSQGSSNDEHALGSKQGKSCKSKEFFKSLLANNFVDLYKNTVTVLVLFCLLLPVVGDQKPRKKIFCKPQQPVSSFRLLTDDAICRQPDQLACKYGFTFICAFHVNGSLGYGCVEKFCFYGQYCPQFTQLRFGEKEETVIQDGGRCSSCNSFYNITDWRKYEECYSLPTTTTGPLDTSRKNITDINMKMADNQETSLKGWEIAIIVLVVLVFVVLVAGLWWKYTKSHGDWKRIIRYKNRREESKSFTNGEAGD